MDDAVVTLEENFNADFKILISIFFFFFAPIFPSLIFYVGIFFYIISMMIYCVKNI